MKLPAWPDYSKLLDALANAARFVTTAEILLLSVVWKPRAAELRVTAEVRWTYPLAIAEILSGDGQETHHND